MLAVALAPIWLLCLVLHLDLQIDGRVAWFSIYVEPASSADAFPEFSDYWADVPEDRRTLEPGDRLLSFGGESLSGASRVKVLATAYVAASDNGVIEALIEREGQSHPVDIYLTAHSTPWRTVPLVVGLGLCSLFALLRGQGRRSARWFAIGALNYSFVWLLQFGGPPWQTHLALFLYAVPASLFLPTTLQAAFEIPERVARRHRPALWVWAFAVPGVLNMAWILDVPMSGHLGVRLLVFCYMAFIGVLLFVIGRNYRHADARGRRQLKWVLLGFWIGLAPAFIGAAVTVVDPSMRWVYELSLVTTPAIPVFILIAIVKDSFLDIDRILTSTTVYSVLVPLGLGVFFTFGSAMADLLEARAGIGRETGLWIAVVLIVALTFPVYRVTRPLFERIVAADYVRVRSALHSLSEELRLERSPGGLLQGSAKRVQEILDLESCFLYVRTDDRVTPIVAAGPYSAPLIPKDGFLIRALSQAQGTVRRDEWRRWVKQGVIDRVEGAALETVGVRLLVPIRRGDEMYAFLCLGEKDSGDVFTPAEVVLIDAMASQISQQLDHQDRLLLEEEARELSAEVAGYLPAAVAEEINRGGDVELGEIDVTIMFVDIRGYSKISETRSAREIFEITSDYTEAVSSVISDHHGVVVEFQGDGLMALFGALGELPDKESAAVRAAQEITRTVRERAFGDLSAGEVDVGVGIATGTAFVGSIRAAGQKVWSAMGNTANYASRLESLTRDLDASIVLDGTTRDRSDSESAEFERHDGIPIKGREGAFSVYAAPLGYPMESSAVT